jgi:hypothetical protein
MVGVVKPEKYGQKIHRWIESNKGLVTNSEKHIVVDIFGELHQTH